MVVKGSRYEGLKYTTVIGKDGKPRKFLHLRNPISSDRLKNSFFVYNVKEREELDYIAAKFSIDTLDWWLLAEINGIDYPFKIQPGDSLIIPDLEILTELLE